MKAKDGMKPKDALLAAFLIAGFAVVVDVLKAVATSGFSAVLNRWLWDVFRANALGLLVAGLGIAFFCALIVAAIQTAGDRNTQRLLDQAERERKERERRLAASREPAITRNDRDDTDHRPAA